VSIAASRYEIRCYVTRDSLTNDKFGTRGILVHSALTPEPAEHGVRQSCTVGVPWANEHFYYGIVAIDSGLNRGKVSNLVSVLIKETPTSTSKLGDAWEDDALVSNLTSSRSMNTKHDGVFQAGATWFRGLSEAELYIIIGGAATFLIFMSVFILLVVCLKKKKKKGTEAPPAYHNIYSSDNSGKSQTTGTSNLTGGPSGGVKDSMNCCSWENDSNVTERSQTQNQKANSGYISEKTSSYIPASALCAPSGKHGAIYRDMYASPGPVSAHQNHIHDSSSVDSKPSTEEGGSNDTVQVSDGRHTPGSFYNNGPMPVMMSSPYGDNGNYQGQNYSAHQSHNNLSREYTGRELFHSDDDEGGFKSQQRAAANMGVDPFHKVVPMPSSDYDSPSIMNGSTYGGSVMSISNSNSKKRTRHISFV